ncbi:hypothetical protein V6N11_077523 [Hibiscus sabdariffa]|uniref:Uncharacterized protein n=1 Tax=Hibiscus sabdariffa TaxID=183260 RepID=A0ABR2TE83_9ROSI
MVWEIGSVLDWKNRPSVLFISLPRKKERENGSGPIVGRPFDFPDPLKGPGNLWIVLLLRLDEFTNDIIVSVRSMDLNKGT